MENSIIDLIAQDQSAADVADAIKNSLYAKASERIDALKPQVGTSIFDDSEQVETEETLKRTKNNEPNFIGRIW